MGLFSKSKDDIIRQSLDFIHSNTNITSSSYGSVIRSIIEMYADAMDDMYSTFDFNIASSFINGANGKYLDYFAESLGMYRNKATIPNSEEYAENLKFYVKDGTFGDINDGQDIIVPSGTYVWSSNGDDKNIYATEKQITLNKDDNEKYFSAISMGMGSKYNASTNSIVNHNLPYTNLYVINTSPIDNGSDPEDDDTFRYRIIQELDKREAGNFNSIKMKALDVNGVSDVKIIDKYMGTSSVAVIVQSITPIVSDSIIEKVSNSINYVKPEGVDIVVMKPIYIMIKLSATVKFKNDTTENERTETLSNIANSIRSIIDNIELGEDFDSDFIVNNIITSYSNVLSIHIHDIYAYKNINGYSISIQSNILQKYTVSDYEKIIAHTDANSIVVE